MEIWFPDWLMPTTTMFGLDDFTAVDSSAVSGAAQSSELFGTRRWHCRMDFPVLYRADGSLQLFQGIVAALRGRAGRALIRDRSYARRGSFPTTELVGNGSFSSSGGWSTSGSSLTVLDRTARVQNTGAAGGAIVSSSSLAVSSGASYIVRAGLYPGNVNAWVVALGSTSGAFDLTGSGAISSPGLYIGLAPGAATAFLSLFCDTAVAGDFVHFTYASVSRGAVVNGIGQTGTGMSIRALPISSTGLLRPGDLAQIVLQTLGSQLVRLTAPLSSDGSGHGYMQFEPALKESPADGAGVVIDNPMGRFMLLNGSVGVELSSGVFGNASLEFIEA